MASIVVYDKDRLQEIENTTVVSGSVNSNGSLILGRRDGGSIDAGIVRPDWQAGTSGQYYRGDKSWANLDKNAVGLNNVDNTADANKPISIPQATGLVAYWQPNTVYTAGKQVISPSNRVVTSRTARTSGATWNGAESANWAGLDEQMVFWNAGFAWSNNYAPWDCGPLSLVVPGGVAESQISPLSPGSSFAVAGQYSGSIKFTEPGEYDIIWNINPDGNPGARQYTINIVDNSQWSTTAPDSVWQRLGTNYFPNNGTIWESTCYAINIRVPKANLTIRTSGQQELSTTNRAAIKIFRKG